MLSSKHICNIAGTTKGIKIQKKSRMMKGIKLNEKKQFAFSLENRHTLQDLGNGYIFDH
jgi:hypothetical protein